MIGKKTQKECELTFNAFLDVKYLNDNKKWIELDIYKG